MADVVFTDVHLDDPQRCPICPVGHLILIERLTAELTLIQDTS